MTGELPRFPVLAPGVRVLWRSSRSVQLELGRRAVIVDGVDSGFIGRLIGARRMPGSGRETSDPASTPTPAQDGVVHISVQNDTARPQDTIHRQWAVPDTSDIDTSDSWNPPALRAALRDLVDAGYVVDDAGQHGDAPAAAPAPRLVTELRALSSRHGTRAGDMLAARSARAVVIDGESRPASLLAAVLSCAGVGRVVVATAATAGLRHVMPGGVLATDEGSDLATATVAAMRRVAPSVETMPLPFGDRPDLVVVAVDEPVDPEVAEALHRRECAHLRVALGPDHGIVGPLVIPGITSCLRCADLHRLDRDPAWTALAVQLSTPGKHRAGSDVAMATTIVGVASGQILAFLDGGDCGALEGTLEIHSPDWRIRRRSWPPHPRCGCGAAGRGETEPVSARHEARTGNGASSLERGPVTSLGTMGR